MPWTYSYVYFDSNRDKIGLREVYYEGNLNDSYNVFGTAKPQILCIEDFKSLLEDLKTRPHLPVVRLG